ncbi:MAG: hypothetical protein E6G67_11635 [Actinobacteria bacterium]|nr:MAG: hypothetical protein E6G67_11635 [Actinomycetota bacterium]
MMLRRRGRRLGPGLILAGLALMLLASPAATPSQGSQRAQARSVQASANAARDRSLLLRSQIVQIRYWVDHPSQAPARLRGKFLALHNRGATGSKIVAGSTRTPAALLGDVRFNLDTSGLPQNEESGTTCLNSPAIVLQGYNDYRGVVSATGDFGGWTLSTNGGVSPIKDGQLPGVTIGGITTPSGGDPVARSDAACGLYASNIDFTTNADGSTKSSGIVLYKSNSATLTSAACTAAAPNNCWPTKKVVFGTNTASRFEDKEWMDVGVSGAAGTVVWVTWTDFMGPSGRILGSRCTSTLSACTAPVVISDAADSDFTGGTKTTQFSYVTIGTDGRVYVSWLVAHFDASGNQDLTTIKAKVANAGSTVFGPSKVIASLPCTSSSCTGAAIGFGNLLHADDFRVATVPKNTMRIVGGAQKLFVTYEVCNPLLFGSICEEPSVRVASAPVVGTAIGAVSTATSSVAGDNYFPTIASEQGTTGTRILLAYYTNRFDPFHHRQDIELVALNPATSAVLSRQRATSLSSEPDADPLLGGTFIGDYIEVTGRNGVAFTHYNANRTLMKLLGLGALVPQQDSYLNRSTP